MRPGAASRRRAQSVAQRLLGVALLLLVSAAPHARAQGPDACARPGGWLVAAGDRFVARGSPELIAEAARRQVVLLGERHDDADHHRWQLQVLAALHALRPDMAIGFEMFPRRVQPVLDRWVAGELGEAEFLRLADWDQVWGFDAQLYLPLLHFARINRIPMLALNVERALVRQVGSGGWDSVPEARREGVGRPAPPPAAHVARLREVFEQHLPRGSAPLAAAELDARVSRFVEAQSTWDRAMAEGIARRARGPGAPLVVGLMGSGHLEFGHGVPHQLRALGIADTFTMMPVEAAGSAARAGNGAATPCTRPPAGIASAVFVLPAPAAPAATAAPPRPRLGVTLGGGEAGVRIEKVAAGSLAERSGLRDGDRVTLAAGRAVNRAQDLTRAVGAQPPGTVLPLTIQREGREFEVLVRFPPAAP